MGCCSYRIPCPNNNHAGFRIFFRNMNCVAKILSIKMLIFYYISITRFAPPLWFFEKISHYNLLPGLHLSIPFQTDSNTTYRIIVLLTFFIIIRISDSLHKHFTVIDFVGQGVFQQEFYLA